MSSEWLNSIGIPGNQTHNGMRRGRVELISGGMFAGKSEELISRLKRVQIAVNKHVENGELDEETAKQIIRVYKPDIDTRYSEDRVDSHSGLSFDAQPISVDDPDEIMNGVTENTRVVGVDEVQFFNNKIIDVAEKLADSGKRVILAGLDTDFRGVGFGPVPELAARAERHDKLHAVCVKCGLEASRTQRLIDGKPAAYDDPVVMVGAEEAYEARCRLDHEVLPPRGKIIVEE